MKMPSVLLGAVMLVLLLATGWIGLPVTAVLSLTLVPALIVIAVAHYGAGRRRRRWYAGRSVLYRGWLARYDESRRSDIRQFLRTYAAAFDVPRSAIHKIGPEDRILDHHRRDPRLGEVDSMEVANFARKLKEDFGYEVAPVDANAPLGLLFEKVTASPARTRRPIPSSPETKS